MKVPNDLRQAIRSAANLQDTRTIREQYESATRLAISKLPKAARLKIKARNDALAQSAVLDKKAEMILDSLGLGLEYKDKLVILDSEKFTKAGGRVPARPIVFKADNIIARLAAAETQKEFDEILSEVGINWK